MTKFTEWDLALYDDTITENPYIDFELYDKQEFIALTSCSKTDGINEVLTGGPGGGGKTKLLSALALQFIEFSHYRCLVTRKNYRELVGTGSVFDILKNIPGLKSRESGLIKIVAPSGAEIHFKAFNDESHKQDVKGESYHTILNDEASELSPSILKFLYRSLRKKVDDWIPLRFINASNPGGESTDYLVEKYIDGDRPYIEMGYKDNPHIDNETYEDALKELDYIDQQYQMHGNWKYKPSVGDLLTRSEGEAQLTTLTTPIYYEIISIDLAGKGKDMFAVVCYDYLQNGLEYIRDFNQTQSNNPESLLLDFIIKHNPNPYAPQTSLIVVEQEGGGSPEYAKKYFENLIMEYGYTIPVILKKPSGSKYQRARPLMHSIRHGNTKLNQNSNYIHDFIDESIQLSPDGKGRSPNLVDSASLARNYLHTDVLGNQTYMSVGTRIGG